MPKNQPLVKSWFSVREAATLSDLTPAMVDYLCRSRVLLPSKTSSPGRGKPRQYSFGDVVLLKALSKLLQCGISVAKLKKAMAQLRNRNMGMITASHLPGKFLVTDGTTVFFTDKGQVEDVLAGGQLAFGFVIEIQKLRNAVTKKIESLGYAFHKTA